MTENTGPKNAGQNVFCFLPLSYVYFIGFYVIIVSASLSISIASEALMLRICRLAYL